MTQPYAAPPLKLSPDNPFNGSSGSKFSRPDARNYYTPGSYWWWLQRLVQKLLDRYDRYDVLERYALGDHPLPNGDYRYVKALKDLQTKARTNYCELVIKATTQRMRVKGFRFGSNGQADAAAKRIWEYNDMDYQSQVNINTAATFGLCYALVAPPDTREKNAEPIICIEDPRMCVVERDPYRITRSMAGLKMWQDDTIQAVIAVLYLPDEIYTFTSRKFIDNSFPGEPTLTKQFTATPAASSFELVDVSPNPLGEVPLIEGNWQPAFGDIGRAEHEGVLDIQDRINHTVLDRLVISKSQAYRQRWATGLSLPGAKGKKRPPFDPGADILWVTANPDAAFGDFDSADIEKILLAIRDDVGDMAAISQTPASYLMNRMVNVSGDTLTQDQSGLVLKVQSREEAMGWFYERALKLCFKYKSDEERYSDAEASTLWADAEKRKLTERADALGKLVAAGVPLEIAMEDCGYSPDQIVFAIQERDRQLQEQQQREDEVATRAHEQVMEQQRVKAVSAGSGAGSAPNKTPAKKAGTTTTK